MPVPQNQFSQEFKNQVCLEVVNTSKPVVDVANTYGISSKTLSNWLTKYRRDNSETLTVLNASERERFRTLEKEVRELRAETVFLKKASAYFAKEQRW